ncbi:Sip1-related alpha-galactosidase [Endozoicomonas sp. SESOKO1]|uniref:Sip1-related alpha-galactosidase n=1 Tax=Endozoicomonas sp. SESOKO1 TaxID=2828742 RepID=UPI00214833AF|nr:Sip1-related alpha-galactosidase [Endozoicomonas sp. SESOKO1]
MYALREKNQTVNLYCDQSPVWHGICVCAHLDNDDKYVLTWSEQAGAFVHEDWLSVRLSLKTVGKQLLVSLDAQINKGISWPGRSWHPQYAVRISINSLGDLCGLCAHYLYNSWWTRPHFDRALNNLPEKTQSLLYGVEAGYHHLLAVCDEQVRCEFQGGEPEGVELVSGPAKSGVREFSGLISIFGTGSDPFQLINDNVQQGRDHLAHYSRPRDQRTLPEVFKYLGWCSWDACYLDVNEDAVIAKAREFQSKGVPLKWMLVDDGWSEEKERRLLSWQEDRAKFPAGLAGLKQALKESYGIPWMGVWHALTGQWEGIDAEASFPVPLDELDSARSLPPTSEGDAFRFWHGWHDYLARQGVDFIKVDVQSNLANHYKYRDFPGKVSRVAHQALEASAGLHFIGQLINCMGMASDQLWNRPSSALARNSDDFFPKKSGNLQEHALQNAYNAVFHDAFFIGDWDMWWTIHEDSDAHALLRAVSGGPIYTSDPVGQTDGEQLMRLVFNDGLVVRCDQQGKVAREQLFENPLYSGKLLQVTNRIGAVGVLALFNIAEDHQPITELITSTPLENDSGEWLVYWPTRRQCFSHSEIPEMRLAQNGSDLLLFHPGESLVCLGLEDKILPTCAVLDQVVFWKDGGVRLESRLRQGGRLLIYSEYPLLEVQINGQDYEWEESGNIYLINCSEWDDEIFLECLANLNS